MSSCRTCMSSLLYHQLTAYMMNKLTFCILSFLLFIIQSLRQYLNIHSSTIGGSNHSLFKQSSSPVKEMKVCVCMYVCVCVHMHVDMHIIMKFNKLYTVIVTIIENFISTHTLNATGALIQVILPSHNPLVQ